MDILRPQIFLSNLYLQKSLFSEYITGRRLWEKLYTETQKTDMSGLLMSLTWIKCCFKQIWEEYKTERSALFPPYI